MVSNDPDQPHRVEVTFMSFGFDDRLHVQWRQGPDGDTWLAYRQVAGINQYERVPELDGDWSKVTEDMRDILSGELKIHRETGEVYRVFNTR